jgi:hypothetical protein
VFDQSVWRIQQLMSRGRVDAPSDEDQADTSNDALDEAHQHIKGHSHPDKAFLSCLSLKLRSQRFHAIVQTTVTNSNANALNTSKTEATECPRHVPHADLPIMPTKTDSHRFGEPIARRFQAIGGTTAFPPSANIEDSRIAERRGLSTWTVVGISLAAAALLVAVVIVAVIALRHRPSGSNDADLQGRRFQTRMAIPPSMIPRIYLADDRAKSNVQTIEELMDERFD